MNEGRLENRALRGQQQGSFGKRGCKPARVLTWLHLTAFQRLGSSGLFPFLSICVMSHLGYVWTPAVRSCSNGLVSNLQQRDFSLVMTHVAFF